MIQHEVTFEVPRPVEAVYAFLADPTKTSSWLSRCVELKQLSPGPLVTGSKLLYRYHEAGTERSMEGEAALVDPNKTLRFRYWDKLVKVQVGFDFEPAGAGTRVRQSLQLDPVSFFMKLLQPMIRRSLAKETAKDVAKLQECLLAQAA